MTRAEQGNSWVWLGRVLLVGLFYLGLQVLFFDSFELTRYLQAHVYLGFLVFLPLDLPRGIAYTIGLVWALVYGQFHPEDRGALVMATTMLLAVRNTWARSITTPSAFSDTGALAYGRQNAGWALAYMAPLVVVYELVLQPLVHFSLGWRALATAGGTALYTVTLLVGVFVLFIRRRRS